MASLFALTSCLTSREEYQEILARSMDVDQDGHWRPPYGGQDCNDYDAAIFPGADDSTCDAIDGDCDGLIDEGLMSVFYLDADGDGYGVLDDSLEACLRPEGYAWQAGDCRDDLSSVNPEAEEICNDGLDNNCDDLPGDCALGREPRLRDIAIKVHGSLRDSQLGWYLESYPAELGSPQNGFIAAGRVDKRVYYYRAPFNEDEIYPSDSYVALYPSGEYNQDEFDYELTGIALIGPQVDEGLPQLAVGLMSRPEARSTVHLRSLSILADEYIDISDAPRLFHEDEQLDSWGWSPEPAGDVNGDGIEDLWVGSGDEQEVAYLYHGPIEGFQGAGNADVTIMGSGGTLAGVVVLGATDFNGDGLPDVVLSDPFAANARGTLYVAFAPFLREQDLEDAEVQLTPPNDGVDHGVAFSLATGDLDGDGHPDLGAGSIVSSRDVTYGGSAYLLQGPFQQGSAWEDHLVAELHGEQEQTFLGLTTDLHDLNGDGLAEWLVGAPYTDYGDYGDAVGAVYLYHGPVEGDVTVADADTVFYGTVDGENLGWSILVAPDLTGDGWDDLILGAPEAATDGSGNVYIVPWTGL